MANNRYGDKKGRLEVKEVRIETVDQAVVDYFSKKLAVSFSEGNERRPVPVKFATGERWSMVRDDTIRDENGTLILPLIAVIRTEINRDPALLRGVGQEVKQFVVGSNIHPKNSNLQQKVYQRKKLGFPEIKREKTLEYVSIPFPDFANLMYEIKIWTQYTIQMNEILEKLFYDYNMHNSFVMPIDYERGKPKGASNYFVGYSDETLSPDSNVEDFSGQERIIKYNYTITVPSYFMLNPKDESTSYGKDEEGKHVTYKKQSSNDFQLKEELLSLEEFEELFGE